MQRLYAVASRWCRHEHDKRHELVTGGKSATGFTCGTLARKRLHKAVVADFARVGVVDPYLNSSGCERLDVRPYAPGKPLQCDAGRLQSVNWLGFPGRG